MKKEEDDNPIHPGTLTAEEWKIVTAQMRKNYLKKKKKKEVPT